jgi:hypothetical protein
VSPRAQWRSFIYVRYRAVTDHSIYEHCRWPSLEQKLDDFPRYPVTLRSLSARAAANMLDFHHLLTLVPSHAGTPSCRNALMADSCIMVLTEVLPIQPSQYASDSGSH